MMVEIVVGVVPIVCAVPVVSVVPVVAVVCVVPMVSVVAIERVVVVVICSMCRGCCSRLFMCRGRGWRSLFPLTPLL